MSPRAATLQAVLRVALWAALSTACAPSGGAGLKSIALLEFELVDDQHELAPATSEYQRLVAIRDQLQQAFTAHQLYRVVDTSPAQALIAQSRSRTALRDCNGCELDIAQALQADRVLLGWVQKVSNLILNINIRIEDATSGAILLTKSVDLRGNTDETWRRGVAALVASMIAKNQGNR